jgi:[ribosomal protein S18]-alanine N-acetyltransferase
MAARAPDVIDPRDADVRIVAMRRRHLRSVLKIERQVHPRPWSHSVFANELGQSDRCYVVARLDGAVAGYGGVWYAGDDAHVTNIAVDPNRRRLKLATRMLVTLAHQARLHGATNLTLEVRVSNKAAQALYAQFGFAPVGIRRRYYENVEDAIIMWATDIHQPAYAERLRSIEAGLPRPTTVEGLA